MQLMVVHEAGNQTKLWTKKPRMIIKALSGWDGVFDG
jgi:hypothetical protein